MIRTQFLIWPASKHLLAPESLVYGLDCWRGQTEASLLNPAACSRSGSVPSGGRGWTSALQPEHYNCSPINRNSTIWIKSEWNMLFIINFYMTYNLSTIHVFISTLFLSLYPTCTPVVLIKKKDKMWSSSNCTKTLETDFHSFKIEAHLTKTWTNLRVSSSQSEFCRKSQSSFTPESCSLLRLRFSTLRWDGLDLRAVASESQLSSDKLQCLILRKNKTLPLSYSDEMVVCWTVVIKLVNLNKYNKRHTQFA